MALKGIVVMKSKRKPRPNGKLRIRIFVPVERVLWVSEFLLNLKDTLIGIYERVSSECSICVTITSVITALRPKKGFKWGYVFLGPPGTNQSRNAVAQLITTSQANPKSRIVNQGHRVFTGKTSSILSFVALKSGYRISHHKGESSPFQIQNKLNKQIYM